MKLSKQLLIFFSIMLLVVSCKSTSPEDEASAPTEDLSALDSTPTGDKALESDLAGTSDPSQVDKPAADAAPAEGQDEFAQFDDGAKQEAAAEPAPPALEEPPPVALEPPPPVVQEPPPPAVEEPPPAIAEATPPPAEEPAPPPAEAPAEAQPSNKVVNIKALQFKGNDNGGTLIVEADGPMTYTTRMNAESGQFVIDIPNSKLPKKLTRPLITKDFQGSIGSVDAYQSAGSSTARVVVHLRQGAAEPVIQNEGNSLLVVASEAAHAQAEAAASAAPADSDIKLLRSTSLEEFMAGNMNFGGKRISLETDEMEMRDIFKLISEEGGVNLVIADEVKGKMTVKLRQVPWDQALVMIMKAKKLSYTRSGNVLRIAPVMDLRKEEDDAINLATAKRDVEPLVVKLIPVSYSKVDELSNQVKSFLSKRGSAIPDVRTASLVVSDIEENVNRIMKLVQSIDIAPQQVLIEGKIVEADDSFSRNIGVNWQGTGSPITMGANSTGQPVIGTLSPNITPGAVSGATGSLGFQVGVLDILGSLSASLQLYESQGTVKILSSPRIVTMHNEAAEIAQSQELPIVTSTATTTGVPVPSVTFKPVKLSLKVTPSVTNDGGVIMKMDVLREIAGAVTDQTTHAFPIGSRSASTKVLVRNGQTAVIGGIYEDNTTETENRVPWLGSIPVVGWLFKSWGKSDTKSELLIFVTPRILGHLDSQAIPQGGGSNP